MRRGGRFLCWRITESVSVRIFNLPSPAPSGRAHVLLGQPISTLVAVSHFVVGHWTTNPQPVDFDGFFFLIFWANLSFSRLQTTKTRNKSVVGIPKHARNPPNFEVLHRSDHRDAAAKGEEYQEASLTYQRHGLMI